MKHFDYDIIIIGAGSGGLPIIRGGANLGLKVALVEKELIGGDCLNFGCVPSKTFIKSANVLHTLKTASDYGVKGAKDISFDFEDVKKRFSKVHAKIEEHESVEYFEKQGVDVYLGSPKFVDTRTIEIDGKKLSAKKFVLATGSRPFIPYSIKGLKEINPITNKEIFSLKKLPKEMIILGGGPIGVEMGQTFSRFGTKVTIIERNSSIMNREDEELVSILQEKLRREGIEIITTAQVVEAKKEKGKKVIVLNKDGKREEISASEVLVALGRKANVEGLDLEVAGVEYTPKNIVVSKRCQTTNKHIFAVGDVAGPYAFSHTAAHMAGVSFANLFFKFPAKVDYKTLSWVTFSDPEFARIGLTEKEAQEQGLKYEVAKFDFSDLDRAITESQTTGVSKFIISKNKIVGAHILGPRAGEIIHEIALAIKKDVTVKEVASMIHAYPTFNEIIPRTLGKYFFKRLYAEKTKKIVQFLFKYF